MKLLIIGSPKTYESKRIVAEAKKRGHSAERADFGAIIFKIEHNFSVNFQEKNIKYFDGFIFRGISNHLPQALLLADYLKRNQKIIIDERLANKRYITSKLSSLIKFKRFGLSVPLTYQILESSGFKAIAQKLGFPLIIKEENAAKGEGIYLLKNLEEAKLLFKKINCASVLIQKYIPSNFDIRVLVLGGRILGAIKRTAKKGEFRSNIAQGGTAEVYSLDSDLKKLAILTAKASDNEFAGIDIMIDSKNKPYILESNRAPQFKGFEEATGINVAQEIVKYIEKKE